MQINEIAKMPILMDEAHQINDAATAFFSNTFSPYRLSIYLSLVAETKMAKKDIAMLHSFNKYFKPKRRGRPKKGETREPKTPSILQQQEDMKTTKQMLSLVSTQCGVGRKQNSKGNFETWIGGKLHISVVDGDIPITAIYSGANVHDSSVALPLINETSKKVSYLYDLQDAGYDSNIIRDFSKKLNHRPLIDINPKNSKELKGKIQLIKDEKKKFEILNLTQSLDTHHYNQRSMVERVNKYLKEDFGCSNIYYKGATKVASVLAFGILSVCIHQSLKMVT